MSQLTSTQSCAETDYIVPKNLAFSCARFMGLPAGFFGSNTGTTTSNHAYIYHGHSDAVYAVAWSHDSKRIASGSSDKTVQVWNATSGNHAYTYRGHTDTLTAIAWSPDDKYLVTAFSYTLAKISQVS